MKFSGRCLGHHAPFRRGGGGKGLWGAKKKHINIIVLQRYEHCPTPDEIRYSASEFIV